MSETIPSPASPKFTLWSLAKVVLGLVLVVFVLSRTSWAEMVSLASRVSWFYFGLTVITFFLLSMLKAWQYYVLLNRQVPYPQALSVVVLQNAVSNFVASSAGVATYMTLLKAEQKVKLRRSASVFILLKMADMASLWVGLLISLVFVWGQIRSFSMPILLVVGIIGGGLLVFSLGLLNRRRFAALVQSLIERTGLKKFAVTRSLYNYMDALLGVDRSEFLHLLVTAGQLSFLYFIVTIAWTYCSLHTFALPATVWVVVFVTSALQLLSIVPVQVFGGLGVSEAASLYLFGLFGFTYAELAAVLIGIRLLFYVTNLLALLYLPLHAVVFGRTVKAH